MEEDTEMKEAAAEVPVGKAAAEASCPEFTRQEKFVVITRALGSILEARHHVANLGCVAGEDVNNLLGQLDDMYRYVAGCVITVK